MHRSTGIRAVNREGPCCALALSAGHDAGPHARAAVWKGDGIAQEARRRRGRGATCEEEERRAEAPGVSEGPG
jgi:hypothetical protein